METQVFKYASFRLTLYFLLLQLIAITGGAQIVPTVHDSIDLNDVNALMYSDGLGFWNQITNITHYRIPKQDSSTGTIFASGLWIAGIDAGGKLHIAASTYKQNGTDYWPGPMMDSVDYSAHQDSVWNKIWKINKSTIDSFRLHKFIGVPASIANWPGNGNISMGEMPQLAPYVDSCHCGWYNPSAGDYPLIRGDQVLYFIFNDDRGSSHGETKGKKLGIEVHLMVYQFKTLNDTAVNQTTFLHYDIYNRSKNTYDSTYLGYYCDMDIGNGALNFIGCDSADNYWYSYNADSINFNGSGNFGGEIGYGGPVPPPPAEGVVYLCDTISHFIYYFNNFNMQGNPRSDTDYFLYLQSYWIDRSHMTYGGTGFHSGPNNANFMFNGDPASKTGWYEGADTNNKPNDVRGLSSKGPCVFAPGAALTADLALVFSRSDTGNQNTSVTTLGTAIADVKNFYSAQNYGCFKTLLSMNNINPANTIKAMLYPNPMHNAAILSVNTILDNAVLKLYDLTGRNVGIVQYIHTQYFVINRNGLANGMYFYVLFNQGEVITSGKVVIQ